MLRVSLLTGGDDPNYAIPLAIALADRGLHVDFVGNDDMESAAGVKRANIHYLNLRGNQDPRASLHIKVGRIVRYYGRLIAYALTSDSRLFHILWLNKFDLLDRTILNLFYKVTRKKLVFTAHNVNAAKRDGRDTWVNRATLRTMYRMVDHVFVHTESSREELVRDYGVAGGKVSVIPFGLNTYVPDTSLSKMEARNYLGLGETEKVLLFFGQIAPYKGLDILLDALSVIPPSDRDCRLVIAGRAKAGLESYWQALKSTLEDSEVGARVVLREGLIPDRDVPILFRASDALVLPYRAIYQSGPLSLAYRFGVPVIATRIGSFDRDVVPEVTGVLCQPDDPNDLARAIRSFFASDLYLQAEQSEKRIRELAQERYSWEGISREIIDVYARL
jgi:D-inositol-3-phosphate glycosyltransferase